MPSLRISPTTILLLKRGVRRGYTTLKRERGWATSLWALLGVVVLMQVFLVMWLGVQGVDSLLRTQTDLRLQVKEAATDHDVQQLLISIKALPGISTVEYITREQAYERERAANPDLIRFLEQFKIQNPFPDTVSVTLKNLSYYNQFLTFLKQPDWRTVVDPAFLSQATDQEQGLRQMLRLTDAGQSVATLFLFLTGGILLFVVVELVRRRAFLRREEVFVERMSGAQEASVVLPFATEATILLVTALLLSLACVLLFLLAFPLLIPALGDSGTFGELKAEVGSMMVSTGPTLFLIELVLAPLAGFAGAYLGTRGGRGSLAMA